MGAVNDAVEDAVSDIIDAVVSWVTVVWDDICMPILEFIFGVFGIDDEVAVNVQKVSTAIYSENSDDVYAKAKTRAVIAFAKTDTGFLSNYIREVFSVKAQVTGFYRYADKGKYVHGLPTMVIRGGDLSTSAVADAIDVDLAPNTHTVLSVSTAYPSGDIYYKHDMQNDPAYSYKPSANTLTYYDPYGVIRSDYTVDSIVFNPNNSNYDITISRVAEEAKFWVEGPLKVTEGEPLTYKVNCNRLIPIGKSVDINFTYSGNAIDGVDYTSVSSVTMTESTNVVDLVITTIENIAIDSPRTITITLDSIDNSSNAFEEVSVHTLDSVTTNILDNDSIVLTLNSVYVKESDVSVTVAVTLEQELSISSVLIPFTVDYGFIDITSTGGVDYDNTAGTLNFTGSANEIQYITIPLTSDVIDGDREQFEIVLSNCSEAGVDITNTAVVTVVDTVNTQPEAGTVIIYSTFNKPNFIPVRTIIAVYHNNNNPSTDWYYWLYDLNSGQYPDIKSENRIITEMEMLPVAILIRDSVSINLDKTTLEYKTTKRLMDFLKLDIEEFITNINTNTDIASIDDAYLNMSMNPLDTNIVVSKMLWLSFYEIIVVHNLTSSTNEYAATFTEQSVNNSVVWSDQTYTTIVGSIGPIGHYNHSIGSKSTVTGTYITGDEIENDIIVIQKTLTIRHQVTDTHYEEIQLVGLNAMSAIEKNGFHSIAINKVGDDNFTIPVSLFIFNSLTAEEQLIVYQYIIRLDIFAIDVAHISWYQTSSFNGLFKFVMIVISIFSLDFSGSIYTILEELILNYLIGELVVFVAVKTGNAEFAAIVGLVATFALSSNSNNVFKMSTADELINLSTNFADNLTLAYESQSEEFINDLNRLNTLARERFNELKEYSVDNSAIDIEFLSAIKSVNTTAFPAINAQYEFDEVYNYDKLVSNFHDTLLTSGIT